MCYVLMAVNKNDKFPYVLILRSPRYFLLLNDKKGRKMVQNNVLACICIKLGQTNC